MGVFCWVSGDRWQDMAFVGERHRLEGDISAKELQRALWTNPPPVRLMPGVPRKLDARGRQQIKKDCDEVSLRSSSALVTVLRILTSCWISRSPTSSILANRRSDSIPPSMQNKGSVTKGSSARTCLEQTYPSTWRTALIL